MIIKDVLKNKQLNYITELHKKMNYNIQKSDHTMTNWK